MRDAAVLPVLKWPDEVHVARAAIPGEIDRAPQIHVFFDQHVSWVSPADDLPRYGRMYSPDAQPTTDAG